MANAGLSVALTLCEEAKLVLKKEVKALHLENERLRKERDEALKDVAGHVRCSGKRTTCFAWPKT
jgi:hypothetical protein